MATPKCVVCDIEDNENLKNCPNGHLVCQNCIHQYAVHLVLQDIDLVNPSFKCPVYLCGTNLNIGYAIADPQIKKQLNTRFTDKNLKNIKNLCCCAGCNSQFILETLPGDVQWCCPHCNTENCIKCRTKYESIYHTCVFKDKENKKKALKNAIMFRKCLCGLSIRRSEDCNHMTCPECGTEFCYLCNEFLEKDRAWLHFCRCPLEGECHCKLPCLQFANTHNIEKARKDFLENEYRLGRGHDLELAHILAFFPPRHVQIQREQPLRRAARNRVSRTISSEENRPVAAPQPVSPLNRRVQGYPRMRTGGWAPRAPPSVRGRATAATAQQAQIPVIAISDNGSSSEAEDAEFQLRRGRRSAAPSPPPSSRILSNSNFIAPFRATMLGQRPSNCRCPTHLRNPLATSCMARAIQEHELTRAAPEPRRRRPPAALATSARTGPINPASNPVQATSPSAPTGPAAPNGPAAATVPAAKIRRRKRKHATNWYN